MSTAAVEATTASAVESAATAESARTAAAGISMRHAAACIAASYATTRVTARHTTCVAASAVGVTAAVSTISIAATVSVAAAIAVSAPTAAPAPVVPGACADEDAARKPARSVVAIGRAGIGIIRVVAWACAVTAKGTAKSIAIKAKRIYRMTSSSVLPGSQPFGHPDIKPTLAFSTHRSIS
jgi:hypothetical protein